MRRRGPLRWRGDDGFVHCEGVPGGQELLHTYFLCGEQQGRHAVKVKAGINCPRCSAIIVLAKRVSGHHVHNPKRGG